MKILFAIMTCHAYRSRAQAQRETWVKDVPEGVDCRFFLGGSATAQNPDEVILDVSGVGYHVHTPFSTFEKMPELGGEVTLQIFTHVREDALSLFGFSPIGTEEPRDHEPRFPARGHAVHDLLIRSGILRSDTH